MKPRLRLSLCCDKCQILRHIAVGRPSPMINGSACDVEPLELGQLCFRCGEQFSPGEQQIALTTTSRCLKCISETLDAKNQQPGSQQPGSASKQSRNRRPSDIRFRRSFMPFEGGLRDLILLLKFTSHHRTADFLGELLALFLRPTLAQFIVDQELFRSESQINRHFPHLIDSGHTRWDLLVPIPSSPKSIGKRGISPVAAITRRASLITHIPWSSKALVTARERRSQRLFSTAGRFENVRGSFIANSRVIQGRSLLLVDDVRTTGATLEEAAHVLLRRGALSVDAVTLAQSRRVTQHE